MLHILPLSPNICCRLVQFCTKGRQIFGDGESSYVSLLSSGTVFLGYLCGNWRYPRVPLISVINFYYIINKLIILVLSTY
jgi:hypothetical protein